MIYSIIEAGGQLEPGGHCGQGCGRGLLQGNQARYIWNKGFGSDFRKKPDPDPNPTLEKKPGSGSYLILPHNIDFFFDPISRYNWYFNTIVTFVNKYYKFNLIFRSDSDPTKFWKPDPDLTSLQKPDPDPTKNPNPAESWFETMSKILGYGSGSGCLDRIRIRFSKYYRILIRVRIWTSRFRIPLKSSFSCSIYWPKLWYIIYIISILYYY